MPSSEVAISDREMQRAIEALMPIVTREAKARKRRLPASIELDDMLQAGRMAAWEAVRKFDGRGDLKAFTVQLVRQRMTDYQRAEHPAGRNGPPVAFVTDEDLDAQIAQPGADPTAAAAEARETYEAIMRGMGPRRRHIVEKLIAGESQVDIAGSLGVSASRVCQMVDEGVNGKKRNRTPDAFDPASVPLTMDDPVPAPTRNRRNKYRELLDRMGARSACVLGNVQAASLVAEMKKLRVACAYRAVSETTTKVWREPSAAQRAGSEL